MINETLLEGETPLDDISGLIPKFVSNRKDLINVETKNIIEAKLKHSTKNQFSYSYSFLMAIHYDMFRHVWKWAGKKRTSNLNIGSSHFQIDSEIKLLLDDVSYWESIDLSPEEIISKFHHRLTKIHPFYNGNGRWSRFVVNIYSRVIHKYVINWPDVSLETSSDTRKNYIQSLKNADNGDFKKLLDFHKNCLQKL